MGSILDLEGHFSLKKRAYDIHRAEANGGWEGRSAPHETICRKILLSFRNFYDLND